MWGSIKRQRIDVAAQAARKLGLGLLSLIVIFPICLSNAYATAMSMGPVHRYESAYDKQQGNSSALIYPDKAYIYDYSVEHLTYLYGDTNGQVVEQVFTNPVGTQYTKKYVFDVKVGCWRIDSIKGKCSINNIEGVSWLGIYLSNLAQNELGMWRYEVRVNGTANYTQQFRIVSGHLRIVGGNPQRAQPNAVSAQMEIQLVEDDGITPLNTKGEGVWYEVTSSPRIRAGDTAAFITRNGLDDGTRRTWDTPPLDIGGFARMYLHYGSVEGQYNVTVTTRFAPFEPQTFVLTASVNGEGDPTDKKNLGEPDCVEGGGRAAATGNPINVATGNKYQKETDMVLTAPALLELVRHYNSMEGSLNSLGWNWRHGYEQSIKLVTIGSGKNATQIAYVTREDGRQYTYNLSSGAWLSESDVQAVLVQTASGWVVTERNITEIYNVSGALTSIRFVDGRTVNLAYDAQTAQLVQVSDDVGSRLTFAYNAVGLVSAVTDQAQREWSFGYDANDNLVSVTNPDAQVRRYHYEDGSLIHALTGISDERGIRYATFEYDANGKAHATYHAGNAGRVDVVYGSNSVRTVTNSRNNASDYEILTQQKKGVVAAINGPGCTSCSTSDTQFFYDPSSNKLIKKIEKGLITEYGGYGKNNRPGYIKFGVGTPDEHEVFFSYDPRYVDLATVERRSALSGITGRYSTVEKTYDEFGNVTRLVRQGYSASGQTLAARQTNYVYDGPLHQLSQIDGPRMGVQDIWTFDYYPNDAAQGSNRARLQRITGPGGVILIDNFQYSATGKPLSEQRANGLALTYAYYPGNDRLESVTESGGGVFRVTRWTYLPTGEVETVTVAADTTDATTITLEYDDARRLTGIRDGLGNLKRFVLNTEGDVESEETYDLGGQLRVRIGRIFDAYNRLQQETVANESRQSIYGADGLVSQTVDGNNSTTTYGYDGLKRITSTTQLVAGVDRTTTYTYNDNGDLTSVTPGNWTNTTSYDVDDFREVGKVTSPDTGVTTYGRDTGGNITSQQDALGRVSMLQYDAFNRLLSLDADGTLDDRSYIYDSCANGVGRLCSLQNGYTTVEYAYDALGNVTSHQGIGYEHDAAGRISALIYPSGMRVEYVHDAAGNVAAIYSAGPAGSRYLASSITYEPFGPVRGLTYGNGLPYSATFDLASRPLTQATTGALSHAYTGYDGNGNLLNVMEQAGTAAQALLQFAYYEDGGLDSAQGPFGTRDYNYDTNGNRTQETHNDQVYAYNRYSSSNQLNHVGNAPHRITSGWAAEVGWYWCQSAVECWVPGTDYTLDMQYNSVGNQTARQEAHYQCEERTYDDPLYGPQLYNTCSTTSQTNWGYSYSAFNQVTHVTAGGVTVADYEYNGLGQRSRKVLADGTATRYVYGLKGELLAETDDVGTVRKEYVYLNGRLLVVNDIAANATYYVHVDHLGTPKVMTGQAGQIVWSAEHDPFGAAMVNEDPDGDGTAMTLNVRFPGQYYDSETGLHYNYFRYYDPITGRYTTSDPIGLAGGLNSYAYAINSPINWSDRLGLYVEILISDSRLISRGSQFGHAAIDINGTIYSRGRSGWFTTTREDYLDRQQNFRDTVGLLLDTTPGEDDAIEAKIVERIEGGGRYDLTSDSCSSNISDALDVIDIETKGPWQFDIVSPADLLSNIPKSGRLLNRYLYGKRQ